jgi:predicted nucleotidyltransferase
VQKAVVFGSVATGPERPESDVDLFVELRNASDRSDVETALGAIQSEVVGRFGNVLSPVVLTGREWSRPSDPAQERAIRAEGLALIG